MYPKIQPWWLSGLIRNVSNSSRDRRLGPEFESRSRHYGPNTGRNSGGRQIKKCTQYIFGTFLPYCMIYDVNDAIDVLDHPTNGCS